MHADKWAQSLTMRFRIVVIGVLTVKLDRSRSLVIWVFVGGVSDPEAASRRSSR
ncbi:hypothetical protein PLANPX_0237 [Lacipirellula parvula]|uniref:Uncharacterized protein n=1 Tax=Lacipirellula parvula TaxID=2650471 RepID=A0A5K7X2R5_9BACT|nr:hypothetical protein PLANPX_0237 [Lacipirellula parvula]